MTRSWTFELTGPRYSANDRLHWRAAQPLKVAWRDLGEIHARYAVRDRRRFTPPRLVRVIATQVPGTRRLTDPGNTSPAVKAAIDGMVRAGFLVDDDAAHLMGPDFRLADPQPVARGQWRLRLTVSEVQP